LRRNCILEHKPEGKIGATVRRRRRRHKQLLDFLKERMKYWDFKVEALARTLWRTRFEKSYGPVERDGRNN